ncbi:MAG: hypothetical protein JWM16_1553 [Verrucomicrobiales bacterium]|nr:hypothetical protein [Verrucomicrobiales bacterium]
MTNKDFSTLAQRLLPNLPGLAIKSPLMFAAPVGHTLRGICFESHSYETKLFYVWVFLQPLCVPTKYLGFSLGKRIETVAGGPWNADAPSLLRELSAALRSQALPFLSHIDSLHNVAEAASSLKSKGPYVQQAIAYVLARAGDVNRAAAELGQLTGLLDAKVPWQREMAERAELLKAKLVANPVDAQSQLEGWENDTAKNLGLESFR